MHFSFEFNRNASLIDTIHVPSTHKHQMRSRLLAGEGPINFIILKFTNYYFTIKYDLASNYKLLRQFNLRI